MTQAEAIKKAIRRIVDEHTRLETTDAMLMYGVLNKYGIDMVQKLQSYINEFSADEMPEKYKHVRGAMEEVAKM